MGGGDVESAVRLSWDQLLVRLGQFGNGEIVTRAFRRCVYLLLDSV